MMDGYVYGMSSGMWILGAIFWILIIVGLVLLIKYLEFEEKKKYLI